MGVGIDVNRCPLVCARARGNPAVLLAAGHSYTAAKTLHAQGAAASSIANDHNIPDQMPCGRQGYRRVARNNDTVIFGAGGSERDRPIDGEGFSGEKGLRPDVAGRDGVCAACVVG